MASTLSGKGLGIAVAAKNRFGCLAGAGIMVMLFLYVFICIGMAPIAGAPLPPISYGGPRCRA